ncbi:ubiquinone/menaquinone biosynthesis C-methylase UbiE [Planomicrobium sp. HSC-17F08]|nr:ubiquinone/menaquinone biosynthesis C-methylase UbiE [Planomicrobium sp. HSC-17F08]
MGIRSKVKDFIDSQYRLPKGLIGAYIGEKMVAQHKPETLWTIDLLDIQPGEKVLELGCGSGYAMKLVLETNKEIEVVGVDLSPVMIRSAAIRDKKAVQKEKAKLRLGNVKSLNFKDEHFEKLYSIHTLYFWEDLSATIKEIFRVLKPGGACVLTLSNGKDNEEWNKINRMIEHQLMPLMKETGFAGTGMLKGPNSREFHTATVTGKKKL